MLRDVLFRDVYHEQRKINSGPIQAQKRIVRIGAIPPKFVEIISIRLNWDG